VGSNTFDTTVSVCALCQTFRFLCRVLGSVEGLDGLVAALDKRGAREGPLYNNLLRYRDAIAQAMPGASLR